jgi:hypothetical protein
MLKSYENPGNESYGCLGFDDPLGYYIQKEASSIAG